jgi:predicted transcriptional regulator
MTVSKPEKMVKKNLYITEDLNLKLKDLVNVTKETESTVMRQALREYFDKYPNKKAKK